MRTIKGVVTWVGDKKKFGNYSFKLKGHDEWFRSPQRCEGVIEKGYTIAVKVEEDDRGDYKVKSKPKLVEKGKPSGGKGGNGRSGGGGQYKEDPEKAQRITMLAAQERALETVKLLIEQGGVKLGAQNKPAERGVQIIELIDEFTSRFYRQAYDPSLVLKKQEDIEKDLDDDESDEDDESFDDADEGNDSSDDSDDGDFGDVPWDED